MKQSARAVQDTGALSSAGTSSSNKAGVLIRFGEGKVQDGDTLFCQGGVPVAVGPEVDAPLERRQDRRHRGRKADHRPGRRSARTDVTVQNTALHLGTPIYSAVPPPGTASHEFCPYSASCPRSRMT